MAALLFILFVLFGYVLGSLCSAIIVSRIFTLPDPRKEGSKNPGATNVLRLSGKRFAVIVMVFDVLKGVVPVLLAQIAAVAPVTVAFTALAAVLGHMYPVFFQFKGGKGVATAIGALTAFNFILGSAVIATWLLVANFTRYSSLASIVSMCLAPLYSLFFFNDITIFPPLFFIALFILFKHRNNITRLIDRTEPKLNFRTKVIPQTESVVKHVDKREEEHEDEVKTPKEKKTKTTGKQSSSKLRKKTEDTQTTKKKKSTK